MLAENTHEQNMKSVAWIAYVALVAGFFTGGLGFLVGLIIAYLKRQEAAKTIYGTHFDYIIATFWWGVFGLLAGFATIFVLVGFPILIFTGFWLLYRLVKGTIAMWEGKPVR
ncbi:hypothetical protein [Mesorhizobium sp. SP-1A]|uniref:DUF4870 family protein n=1 Tax=Mesorhizobium sp. SP-1A TaxID=3077840 RepID=UPI0028F73B27|nr:hypothetical protein [Mesorhizobium sp. SP-1A]